MDQCQVNVSNGNIRAVSMKGILVLVLLTLNKYLVNGQVAINSKLALKVGVH